MSRDQQRLADYLGHILEAIDRINRYTDGLTQSAFIANEMAQDAVIRNAVAHGYFSVDLEVVWKTISSNLPDLFRQVQKLLQDILEDEQDAQLVRERADGPFIDLKFKEIHDKAGRIK